jgi:hypothetical protein
MILSTVPGKKSPETPLVIDPGTVRLVAQRLNHYDTPGDGVIVPFINIDKTRGNIRRKLFSIARQNIQNIHLEASQKL